MKTLIMITVLVSSFLASAQSSFCEEYKIGPTIIKANRVTDLDSGDESIEKLLVRHKKATTIVYDSNGRIHGKFKILKAKDHANAPIRYGAGNDNVTHSMTIEVQIPTLVSTFGPNGQKHRTNWTKKTIELSCHSSLPLHK